MDTEADEATHPFTRLADERPEHHRAMLLYAMQDPADRSKRLVSRAIGRHESTIRAWSTRHTWDERLSSAGPAAQPMALATYRRDYLSSKGRLELEVVRVNIGIPLVPGDTVDTPPPESVTEGAFNPKTGEARPGNAQGKGDERPNEELQLLRKGVVLYDAAIAQFARDLAAGDVSVKARDLPFILASRRKLSQDIKILEGGGAADTRLVEIPESYRVKQARQTGGDVIGAMAEDASDLALLLRAMNNQRRADHELREAVGD